ncbi:ATP-binding protein [Kordiimonas pumila]|uniref:histidine kinase n=1 Tax=Kordiimonas pumila TaxID=2161677 RepID=A0ABV7D5Y4_9PROT|nr:ATP-binding protein [Kordiimonas pumila]
MNWYGRKVEPETKRELDSVYQAQLNIISLVICSYYTFISISHVLVLEADIFWPIFTTSVLTAVTALAVNLLLRLKRITADQCHKAFIPIGLFALTTVYTHVFTGGNQMELMSAILILYGFGFVTLSPVLYYAFTGIAVLLYLLALAVLPGDYALHFMFVLIAALALSVMGFNLRYITLYKWVKLSLVNKQRTQSLAATSKQLREKMAELQQANAARDVFLANVTHELRTPLTGVMGMLDLLEDTGLEGDRNLLVTTAKKSAIHLMHIVNDLLDLAQLDAKKLALRPRTIDVVTITRDVVESLRGQAQAKGIALDFILPQDKAIYVHADGMRISQILFNLMGNAVKFTDEGSVLVYLVWTPAEARPEQKKDQLVWHIADTGPGIPEEKSLAIFERFEQVDSAATRASYGTGLGLAIVHELLDLMQGSVSLKSEIGKGSIFTVTLQLDSAEPELADQKASKAVAYDDALYAELGLRVLLAEDNEINQVLISRILGQFGMEVSIVSNGEEAVQALSDSEEPFDLIFMDAQMPVMDGITAARVIKAKFTSSPPIIAMTANTSMEDIADYKSAGMAGVIAKPIDLNQFRSIIMQVLQQKDSKP